MPDFKDRERDFENKYAHDKQIEFQVDARCSKIFGLWAAQKLGLSGAEAEKYAMGVVSANLEISGFDDVLKKVDDDFRAKNISMSKHLLDVELGKALKEAKHQIMTETK